MTDLPESEPARVADRHPDDPSAPLPQQMDPALRAAIAQVFALLSDIQRGQEQSAREGREARAIDRAQRAAERAADNARFARIEKHIDLPPPPPPRPPSIPDIADVTAESLPPLASKVKATEGETARLEGMILAVDGKLSEHRSETMAVLKEQSSAMGIGKGIVTTVIDLFRTKTGRKKLLGAAAGFGIFVGALRVSMHEVMTEAKATAAPSATVFVPVTPSGAILDAGVLVLEAGVR